MSEQPINYQPTVNASGNPIGMIDGHLGGYFVEYIVDDQLIVITSGSDFREEIYLETENFDDVLNAAWAKIVEIQEP